MAWHGAFHPSVVTTMLESCASLGLPDAVVHRLLHVGVVCAFTSLQFTNLHPFLSPSGAALAEGWNAYTSVFVFVFLLSS